MHVSSKYNVVLERAPPISRTVLRIMYLIAIGLYAVGIVVQARRRELTGTKLKLALAALGFFSMVLVANVLRW